MSATVNCGFPKPKTVNILADIRYTQEKNGFLPIFQLDGFMNRVLFPVIITKYKGRSGLRGD